MRRLLMNAIALTILYGNVAVALQPPPLRQAGLRVPRPAFIHDAFLMTGMFSSFSTRNNELFIAGLRGAGGARPERGRWLLLRVKDHLPLRHGVSFTQLFAAHHWDIHGRAAQRRAWAFLAARIRERHNRLHPDQPVTRVRFGIIEWPQSPKGYRAGKRSPEIRTSTWYGEPAEP